MKLNAYILHELFRNKENNYTIYKISLEETGDVEILKGHLPELSSDILYEFEVEEVVHPKYGVQYNVLSYKQTNRQNKVGLISYFSSNLFMGVGPVKATNIVNTFGDDAIRIILEDKTVLKKVGFNPLQIERFYKALVENQALEQTLTSLFNYGISTNLSMKLYNHYGDKTMSVLENDPYQLIYDIDGIGFIRADEIAQKLGIKEDDPRRIKAAIMFGINEGIFSKGNTYLDKRETKEAIYKIMPTVEDDIITSNIDKLIKDEKVVYEHNTYTLKYIKDTEERLAQNLLKFDAHIDVDVKEVSVHIKDVEDILGITYTDLQKEAIIQALKNPISVITGGPGTGKTTVLQGLVMVYALLNKLNIFNESIVDKIALAAPTGRASRRMKEVMDIPAFTIHKLLGADYTGQFYHNENNLLPQNLYIIDETSMIDIFLADQLMRAIPKDAKIVLVGDKDQLPSVSPGQVLSDIIASNKVPVIFLDEIHRQAKNSGIIGFSNDVNKQRVNLETLDSKDDILFVKMHEFEIIDYLIKLTENALESGYDLIEDIQILIPIYRSQVGIDAVNKAFQNYFQKDKDTFVQFGSTRYFIGDKVIQLKNDVDKDIMNGDIGIVKDIITSSKGDKSIVVSYLDNDVLYDLNELEDLNLAYAISVHKSQGSEYKIVLMPLSRSYQGMLRKELLYTGITRAKAYLYLIGTLPLVETASKVLNEKRKTKLKDYLMGENTNQNNRVLTPYDFME